MTKLYHGSPRRIDSDLKPILRNGTADQAHTRGAVFATERPDIAALFMLDSEKHLSSVGFENDIAYICIWGTPEEFAKTSEEGFLYVLPGESFEKIGKDYEWQSFEPVKPIEVKYFASVIDGMIECGAQVYFINDDAIFDRIVADKANRAPILRNLLSENKRRNSHATRAF